MNLSVPNQLVVLLINKKKKKISQQYFSVKLLGLAYTPTICFFPHLFLLTTHISGPHPHFLLFHFTLFFSTTQVNPPPPLCLSSLVFISLSLLFLFFFLNLKSQASLLIFCVVQLRLLRSAQRFILFFLRFLKAFSQNNFLNFFYLKKKQKSRVFLKGYLWFTTSISAYLLYFGFWLQGYQNLQDLMF